MKETIQWTHYFGYLAAVRSRTARYVLRAPSTFIDIYAGAT